MNTPLRHCTFSTKAVPKAFTLIELLVVISIISLLVSMLLPALSSARARAKQLLCLTNQKQITTSYTFYANEYKGWFPLVNYADPRLVYLSADELDPYFGNTSKLITCPDYKMAQMGSTFYVPGNTNASLSYSSYYFSAGNGTYPNPNQSNLFFGWQGHPGSTRDSAKSIIPNINYVDGDYTGESATKYIPSPSLQPVVMDGHSPTNDVWGSSTRSLFFNPHRSSSNIAYIDGHANMAPFDDIRLMARGMYWDW